MACIARKILQNKNKRGAPTLEVELDSGQRWTMDLPAVLGAPGRPLGRERHLAKFRIAAASGLHPLPAAHITALQERVDSLESVADIRELVDLLVFPGAGVIPTLPA